MLQTLSKTVTMTLTLAFGAGCVDSTDWNDTAAPVDDESQAPDFLDTDSNTLYDAVDRDRDAEADYRFAESSVANALIDASICLDPELLFLDSNGDGRIDALDLDCDGQPDLALTPPGSPDPGDDDDDGTGPGDDDDGSDMPPSLDNECTALVAIDGDIKRVDCSSDATGTTCTCYRNDVMVDSCSQPGTATCSVLDGCCDFGD